MNKRDKLLVVGKGYPQKNLFLVGGDMTYGAIGTAANAGADALDKAFINKGAHNKVGDVLNTASDIMPAWTPYTLLAKGILKTAGIIANGFTNSVNTQQVKQKSAEIANFANQTSNATDYNQLQEDYNNLQSQNIDLGKIDDWGSAGFLSSGSKRKNAFNSAKNAFDTAFRMRKDGLSQRGQNINLNNTMLQMQNLAAFGGPLGDSFGGALGIMQQNRFIDAINNRSNAIAKGLEAMSQQQPTTFTNRFDAGGFVDSFMQDPVAAAMNYIKQRDAEEAQAEAQAAQEAREQAFANIQTRLMNAETQNQGLQALLEDQNRSIAALQEAQNLQEAAVLPTPSTAVTEPVGNNSTWDYIEGQLKRSGKFNDVQIEGIKYNLQRESALNPYAVGDNGEAFGLGQWHGSRQPKDRSLAGQTQHLIDTLSNYDGTRHWIGRGNYEGFLNARTPEEAHYYITKGYERPAQRILNKVKRDSDMSLRNLRAFGGELGTNGADFTNGLLQVNAGNTHERNPFGGVPMGLDPQGIPNLVEEGETVFNDYVFSKRLKVPNFMLKDLGLGGVIHKGKRHRMSFADVSKKLAEESEMRPNDPISMNGLQASLSKLMEIQEAERMKEMAKVQNKEMEGLEFACGGKLGHKYARGGDKSSNHDYGKNANTKKSASKAPFNWTFNPYIGLDSTPEGEMARLAKAAEDARIADENASLRAAADAEAGMARLPGINRNNGTNGNNNEYNPYPTWMRYAPAIGAGIFTLTDTLGLTNKPDYTYADKIEAAANRAGYAPNINYNPIGEYLKYNPLDVNFYANQLRSTSAGNRRAILNSNASAGARNAMLLAQNYNDQNALGNLYRQAEEYNTSQRAQTADFNRRTDMANSQMGLEADIANARYRQVASQMGLSGLAQAAAIRDAIDQRVGAARSANITNFLNSLGNIGRENFALNQINSDRSNRFGARASGTSYYKGTGKSKGGKIQRRKK